MKNFVHKGFEITFNEGCEEFRATVKEVKLSAPSLAAIRRKIDAALIVEFKPFKAVSGSLTDLEIFDVVGIAKSEGFRRSIVRGETVFICKSKNGQAFESDDLVPATSENLAQIKAANATWERCRKAETKLEEERNAARRNVPSIRARDYGALKVKP